MKKIIFATSLLVALASAALAGENNYNRKLLGNLTKAMETSSVKVWSTKNNYQKRETFDYNGKVVSACFFADDDFAGFSIPLMQSELPFAIADAVSIKYSKWETVEVILFIDATAKANYFLHI